MIGARLAGSYLVRLVFQVPRITRPSECLTSLKSPDCTPFCFAEKREVLEDVDIERLLDAREDRGGAPTVRGLCLTPY